MLEASLEREKQKDQQLAELQKQLKEVLSQLVWFKRKMFGSISEKYPNITPRRYIYDGNLQIDNNLAENVIRPITVSRKNFLFCGNHNAASNAAMIFSLIGCCREQNINTRHYLIDVLNRLPYILDKKESLDSLMPDRWIEQHPESLLCTDLSKVNQT